MSRGNKTIILRQLFYELLFTGEINSSDLVSESVLLRFYNLTHYNYIK